jgi:hypothetical protein
MSLNVPPDSLPGASTDDAGDRPTPDAATSLLRAALREPPPLRRSLLPGIKERLRVRTRGRYFRDRSRLAQVPLTLVLGVAVLLGIFLIALALSLGWGLLGR